MSFRERIRDGRDVLPWFRECFDISHVVSKTEQNSKNGQIFLLYSVQYMEMFERAKITHSWVVNLTGLRSRAVTATALLASHDSIVRKRTIF